MTALPSVDQFSPFIKTVYSLSSEAHQCIWYLPNKRRLCLVSIKAEDKEKAVELAKRLWVPGLDVTSAFGILAEIAERTCCVVHHRNKIHGSGLARKLATRWLSEMNANVSVKNEHYEVTPSAIAFVRHEVYKSESLISHLRSDINLRAPTEGSIYFYAHEGDAFRGMIKIGYTSRQIESRLFEWSKCGYGYPKLLESISAVRHPERVEVLTHFELLEWWHELEWCNPCGKAHIEWFKVKLEKAWDVSLLWSKWMRDANPYVRGGLLKRRWREHIEFLIEHENPITAKTMYLIHQIEVGLVSVDEFVDDMMLRKEAKAVVKKEEE